MRVELRRRELKRRALERDGSRCQNARAGGVPCAASEELTMHHILPLRGGGPDILDNVVIWCRPCHEGHHRAEVTLRRHTRTVRKRYKGLGRGIALSMDEITLLILFLFDPEAWEVFRHRFITDRAGEGVVR